MANHNKTTPKRRRQEKIQATIKHKLSVATTPIDRANPSNVCHKCGGICWSSQPEPLTWSCVYCGNRAYYTHGVLQQQIDSIMNSGRKGEFVRSVDGKTISAKKNEDIKRIQFRDSLLSKVTTKLNAKSATKHKQSTNPAPAEYELVEA
jgi:hypothetical protein